jgi:hypothetical protein
MSAFFTGSFQPETVGKVTERPVLLLRGQKGEVLEDLEHKIDPRVKLSGYEPVKILLAHAVG